MAKAYRDGWQRARSSQTTSVAVAEDKVIGFADLERDGHLDMMFVHPSYARRGVATALLAEAEAVARALGLTRIFTEASLTARQFFQANAFLVVVEQTVEKRGVIFTNVRMEKRLSSHCIGAQ